MFRHFIASFVCLTFILSDLPYVDAHPFLQVNGDFIIDRLPVPGTMIDASTPFIPLALKALVVDPRKPLELKFIVDTGQGPQDAASVKEQANQLVKYFLAGLTIPEGDLWVNLSPYEKDRIAPKVLGQTDLGRDLLAQDYVLKQSTASLICPEKGLGKEFWDRVYQMALKQFGTTNVPINTFNKVWILPNQAQVFENGDAAYVTKSTLKIMLEEDYLALRKHGTSSLFVPRTDTHAIGANIVRQVILPEIEKEINTGRDFAPLRQIYQALILAKWYKETMQNGLLNAIYTNKKKIAGINLYDPTIKEQIYQRYLKAYKKGAFNYIKEDPTPNGQVIPSKYFSGGIPMIFSLQHDGAMTAVKSDGAMMALTVDLTRSARGPKGNGSFVIDHDLLSDVLDHDERIQNDVFKNVKVVVSDVGGTLDDGIPENLERSIIALGNLLNTGMPVKIVTTGGFKAELYRKILDRVYPSKRNELQVYWGGGVILMNFDGNGTPEDATNTLGEEYKENNFLAFDVYQDLVRKVDSLSPHYGIRITFTNEADKVGVAQFGIGPFQSDGERQGFIKSLNDLLSDNVRENIAISTDGLFGLIVRKKGFVKRRVFDDVILKQFKPRQIIYFGDEFQEGGVDNELSELGIWPVSVDKNQSLVPASVIKFDGFTGVNATVQWLQSLEKYRRFRAIKEELIQAFDENKPLPERVAGLIGPKRFENTPLGYRPKPASGVALTYLIGSSNRMEDISLQGKLEGFADEFFDSLTPTLRKKIAVVDYRSFHVTIVDLLAGNNPKLRAKIERLMPGIIGNLRHRFGETSLAKITGIDMFYTSGSNKFNGVIKFRLEWDKEFLKRFAQAVQDMLSEDDEISTAYDKAPDWSKPENFTYHITLGYLMKPLTMRQIDKLVNAMKNSSASVKHIDFQLPLGEMVAYTDMNTFIPIGVKLYKGVNVAVLRINPKIFEPHILVSENLEGKLRPVDRRSNFISYEDPQTKEGLTERITIRAKVSTIAAMINRFKSENPDVKIEAMVGNENLFYNTPIVTVQGNRVYHAAGKNIENRQYPMYVVWNDNHVTIEDNVKFKFVDQERKVVKVFIDDKEVNIKYATVIQLVKNGDGFVNPGTYTYFYDDVRHLFSLPRFTEHDLGIPAGSL